MYKKISLITIGFVAVCVVIFSNCKKSITCSQTCPNNQTCVAQNTCGCPSGFYELNGICLPDSLKNTDKLYTAVDGASCKAVNFGILYMPNSFAVDTPGYAIRYYYYNTQSKTLTFDNFSTFATIYDSTVTFTADNFGMDQQTLTSYMVKAKVSAGQDSIYFRQYTTVQELTTNVVLSRDTCFVVYKRVKP
jgi:hypothetical protein